MSHMHAQPATPRADRPARRTRRSTSPTLTLLEERRLMSADVAATTTSMDPTAATTLAAPARMMPTIAPADDSNSFVDPAATDDWIYSGSDAQFGPAGSIVLYGGGNAWPTTSPSTPSSVDPSSDQAKLDAAFAKQSADMQAIQDKSQVTPALLASLRAARSTVADQAGAPDATLLKTYQADVQAVQTSGTFTDAQKQQLQGEYTAVLKSAGVSDAAIAGLFAAQDAVKTAGGVTSADVATLAADQQAVQTLMDAMPQGAIAYSAASDAFRANAAGAPGMMQPGVVTTAVPTTATTTANPTSMDGTITTTAVPAVTTTSTTTTAAPTGVDPSQMAAARAAAVGAIPVGVRVPKAGENFLATMTTASVPNYHSSSSVTPLAGAMKRLSARTLNNTQGVRRGTVVRTLPSGTATATAFPAIRQRLAFAGSMRQARTS